MSRWVWHSDGSNPLLSKIDGDLEAIIRQTRNGEVFWEILRYYTRPASGQARSIELAKRAVARAIRKERGR